jgi:hypothetical protein
LHDVRPHIAATGELLHPSMRSWHSLTFPSARQRMMTFAD